MLYQLLYPIEYRSIASSHYRISNFQLIVGALIIGNSREPRLTQRTRVRMFVVVWQIGVNWRLNADWLRCIEVRICRLSPSVRLTRGRSPADIAAAHVEPSSDAYSMSHCLVYTLTVWCIRMYTLLAAGDLRADIYSQRWLGIVYHVVSLQRTGIYEVRWST